MEVIKNSWNEGENIAECGRLKRDGILAEGFTIGYDTHLLLFTVSYTDVYLWNGYSWHDPISADSGRYTESPKSRMKNCAKQIKMKKSKTKKV